MLAQKKNTESPRDAQRDRQQAANRSSNAVLKEQESEVEERVLQIAQRGQSR
jgi:hypothetical protein